MDAQKAKLTLSGVRDDASILYEECEAVERVNREVYDSELEYFEGQAPISFLSPTPIVEFIIPLAQLIGPTAGTVLVAWLSARAGRKVKFKLGDIEIEAGNVEEVNRLLDKAMALQAKPAGSPER